MMTPNFRPTKIFSHEVGIQGATSDTTTNSLNANKPFQSATGRVPNFMVSRRRQEESNRASRPRIHGYRI